MPKFTPESLARCDKFNLAEIRTLLPRYITELTLIAQEFLGCNVDGRIGPDTFRALDARRAARAAADAPPAAPAPAPAPVELEATPPAAPVPEAPPIAAPPAFVPAIVLPARPRSYADAAKRWKVPVKHFSGDEESAQWRKSNIVECHGPGGRFPGLEGNQAFYFKIHRDVEPWVRRGWAQALRTSAWAQALAAANPSEGLRTGGYVYRRIRHDPKRGLSPHGLGVAFDCRPDLNPGVTVRRGDAPIAFSDAWFQRFPGSMDREFVQAFKDHGFTWGADWDQDGRTDDEIWLDLMHFEWVDRPTHRSEPT